MNNQSEIFKKIIEDVAKLLGKSIEEVRNMPFYEVAEIMKKKSDTLDEMLSVEPSNN